MPRRPGCRKASGLCPWFGLCPTIVGQRPYQGRSPFFISLNLTGEAEPRLTSGGGASPHIRRRSRAAHPAAEPRCTSGGVAAASTLNCLLTLEVVSE